MTSTNPIGVTRVIVGVDTHRDEHVAMAIDCLGARLDQRRLPTAPRGYESLHCWASGLGEVVAFGIEGTGSSSAFDAAGRTGNFRRGGGSFPQHGRALLLLRSRFEAGLGTASPALPTRVGGLSAN